MANNGVYFDRAFSRIRTGHSKWVIPIHAKLALEQSIKRGKCQNRTTEKAEKLPSVTILKES